jgi:hypothetical protein
MSQNPEAQAQGSANEEGAQEQPQYLTLALPKDAPPITNFAILLLHGDGRFTINTSDQIAKEASFLAEACTALAVQAIHTVNLEIQDRKRREKQKVEIVTASQMPMTPPPGKPR